MTAPLVIADPTTVTLKPSNLAKAPQVVCSAIGGPVMIYNADILNVVYVGYRPEVVPAIGTPIQPLTSVVIDGHRQIYGYNGNATDVLLNVTPGGTSQSPSPAQIATQINALGLAKDTSVNNPAYGPPTSGNVTALPAQTASQIAVTGAPLLRNEVAISSGSTAALAAGANTTVGPFSLNTPSYELRVTLTATALTATCNGQVTLKWSNSSGATQLQQKSFSAIASTGGHVVSICGPVRGSSLSITFTNASLSATTLTFAYTLVASSRLAFNDLIRTLTNAGSGPPTVVTWSGLAMDFGILGNATPSIATGGNAQRGLAAYNGPVQIQAVTASGLNDAELLVQVLDATVAVNYAAVFDGFTDGKGKLNAQFNMPMAQCFVQVVNRNAATQVIDFSLTTAEPNVN